MQQTTQGFHIYSQRELQSCNQFQFLFQYSEETNRNETEKKTRHIESVHISFKIQKMRQRYCSRNSVKGTNLRMEECSWRGRRVSAEENSGGEGFHSEMSTAHLWTPLSIATDLHKLQGCSSWPWRPLLFSLLEASAAPNAQSRALRQRIACSSFFYYF